MSQNRTIMLIGCSKSKIDRPSDSGQSLRFTPEELYTGTLFRKRVELAKLRGVEWHVLSARYGLVDPSSRVSWYDETLAEKCKLDIAAWHLSVAKELVNQFEDDSTDPSSIMIEIHAGRMYASPLGDILSRIGFSVMFPVQGMGIGEQLQWYTETIDSRFYFGAAF